MGEIIDENVEIPKPSIEMIADGPHILVWINLSGVKVLEMACGKWVQQDLPRRQACQQ